MTLRNRLTLVSIGVILFLLVTPFLVLYARGFKIDWENRKFVKTGTLVVKSEPGKALVFLNDQAWESTTPINIKFLLPGDYVLRIEKEQYQSWTKRLAVKSQLVTWANLNRDFITLFFSQPKLEQTIAASGINLDADQQKITFLEQTEPKSLNVETTEFSDLQSLPLPPAPLTPQEIVESLKTYKVVLPNFSKGQIVRAPGQIFLILDETLYSINGELEKIYSPVTSAYFDGHTSTLLFSNDNEIFLYYLSDKKYELVLRTLSIIKNPVLNPETGYVFFQNEEKIKAIEWDSRDHRNIFTIAPALEGFALSKSGKKLFVFNQTEIRYYIIR